MESIFADALELFLFLCFVAGFGVIAYVVVRGGRQLWAHLCALRARTIADESSPVEADLARVVTKRTQVTGTSPSGGAGSAYTYYFCTFQFGDGSRQEFRISGSEFGLLVEGDEGELTFQGSRYQGFERQAISTLFFQ